MHSQLGTIIFEGRRGFTSLSSTREANYAEHALIENKPKLQRVGQNLEVIEGVMFFDMSFCDPQEEIDKLESSREIGEIMPLIMGDGRFVGEFVIKTLKNTQVYHADNGRTLQAEIGITLLEYWDADREANTESSAIAQAFANPDNSPSTYTPRFNGSSFPPPRQAMQGVVDANAAATTASGVLSQISSVVSEYRPKAEQVIQNMVKAGDDLADVLELINADPASEMYARTRELALNIGVMQLVVSDVVLECEALISDIDANNTLDIPARIVSLVSKGTETSTQAKKISSSASSLTALVVTQ
jgi:phage protein U